MISHFKTKPKLQDLIPETYADIHSHLLPGIDDGAKSVEDSGVILNAMKSFGFKKVITTPHTLKDIWNNTTDTILQAKELVLNQLPQESRSVNLECASEYFIDENFLELFKTHKLLTLKENYVLVEISYFNAPAQLYDILFELQLAGYKPVLAHPERYAFYHNNFKEYHKLKKAGCVFQINLLSAVGYYGKEIANTADKLLIEDLYDFAGSDIHHLKHIQSFQSRVIIKSIKVFETIIEANEFFNS